MPVGQIGKAEITVGIGQEGISQDVGLTDEGVGVNIEVDFYPDTGDALLTAVLDAVGKNSGGNNHGVELEIIS